MICAVPECETAKVEWFVPKESTEEILPVERTVPRKPKKSSVIFLRNVLAGGERLAKEVLSEGEAAGFSPKEIRTARGHLGIQPRRVGFGEDGKYYWGLPDIQ